MNDDELRQAMAILESYNAQLESITRQVKFLQMSLEEVTRARESIRALNESKEGDEILLPVGASSFVPVKVTGQKKVVVGIGNRVSVEKSMAETMSFMEANGAELSEALKKAIATLNEVETMADNLTMAVQNEYRQRQAPQ